MANSTHRHLEAVDDDTIGEMVKEAINSGRKATFYLSSAQSYAVRSMLLSEGCGVVAA